MERPNAVTTHGKGLTLVGSALKVGDRAPSFTVIDQKLNPASLSDFAGQAVVISVTPSLDTAVCELQARRFNEEAASLPGDAVILNISMDLPSAIARFCTAAGIDRVKALSDHREAAFGRAYGVLIKELRLLARSVFIVDKGGLLSYIEIVPDISEQPDYDRALRELAALGQ